jgi:hypothetical protein
VFRGSRARPARIAHNLTATCLHNVGSSTSHNPIGLHGPVSGIALQVRVVCLLTTQNPAVYLQLKRLSEFHGSGVAIAGGGGGWLAVRDLGSPCLVAAILHHCHLPPRNAGSHFHVPAQPHAPSSSVGVLSGTWLPQLHRR